MQTLLPVVTGMTCIRCQKKYPIGDYFSGCPDCRAGGTPANLTFSYEPKAAEALPSPCLPYAMPVILGEGDTPLVPFPRLAGRLGIKAFQMKNEFQNPTGSHKDRMSPLVIARAKETGSAGVVIASSGNSGLSLAAYAANMDMPCRVVMSRETPDLFHRAIKALGAKITITETSRDRVAVVRQVTETKNFYPATETGLPTVGASPYGIQGYKMIAAEIAGTLGDTQDLNIVVPTGRGDLLWGLYEGFADMAATGRITHLPRLTAVEPQPRLKRVLAGEPYTTPFEGNYGKTPSIGLNTVTYQSYQALRATNGIACPVFPDEVENAVRKSGEVGVFLENSAAVAITAVQKLKEQKEVGKSSTLVMIATSHGFKNGMEKTG